MTYHDEAVIRRAWHGDECSADGESLSAPRRAELGGAVEGIFTEVEIAGHVVKLPRGVFTGREGHERKPGYKR